MKSQGNKFLIYMHLQVHFWRKICDTTHNMMLYLHCNHHPFIIVSLLCWYKISILCFHAQKIHHIFIKFYLAWHYYMRICMLLFWVDLLSSDIVMLGTVSSVWCLIFVIAHYKMDKCKSYLVQCEVVYFVEKNETTTAWHRFPATE
jgi:hypothetical protein